MEALTDLAAIWIGVIRAVIAARYAKLTPVLFFLAAGAIMVNLGVLPAVSHHHLRGDRLLRGDFHRRRMGFPSRT